MGSGASNLTAEEKSILTQDLKTKFEALKLSGVDEKEFGLQMIKEYKAISEKFHWPATTSSSPVPSEGAPSKSIKKKRNSFSKPAADGEKSVPHYAAAIVRKADLSAAPVAKRGRRRSFGGPPVLKRRKSISKHAPDDDANAVLEAVAAAVEATEEPVTEQPQDSWESVTQQLVCPICTMAFKSESVLQRHIQFSSVHAKNVARANGELLEPEPIVPSAQTEGIDYMLYYHGNKFFWRQQRSVDIDIYLHVLPHTFEIVCLDTEKNKEFNRLYIDSNSMEAIMESRLREAVFSRMVKDRFSNEKAVRDELKRTILITAILERLQLHNDITENGGYQMHTIFVLQSGDSGQNPCYEKPPKALIPIAKSKGKRRNSTAGEANVIMSDVARGYEEVSMHLQVADRMLNFQMPARPTLGSKSASVLPQTFVSADKVAKLVQDAVTYLTAEKWWHKLNRVRQRWIKAIRLVIRKRLVVITKTRLHKGKIMRAKSILRRAPSTRAKEL